MGTALFFMAIFTNYIILIIVIKAKNNGHWLTYLAEKWNREMDLLTKRFVENMKEE